ncbi:transcriptional regulator [Sphingomonas histidinilytica]|uniref:transcriptional regulator n=1 Tax=Rhizorhabdus histidinilytica TaxID=439228 RepID=UPI00063F5E82|nr:MULTISPECIES: transcriptional regulator [Sphingomonadaceae]MBO9380422.1 transcriptional regulator [Rhizorhabdus histidinilytica]
MAKPGHDWYFNQWLAHFEKSQADVVQALEWNKSKVSLFASGKQRYHRDDVNQLAAYLNLEPFELLLPPDRAMAIRRLRENAIRIASDTASQTSAPPTQANGSKRTGTGG